MKRSLGFLCILATLLTACGGGAGGAASSVVPLPGGGAPQASAQAKVTIVRPAAATTPGGRSGKFIPATAQSIRVHVQSVNGATPDYGFFPDVIILLSTLNPACTTLSNGGLSCSVTVKVPQSPGVVLQISAYSSTDGSGAAVATLTTPPIDTTQPNPVVSASLGGVPASLIVSSAVLTAPADGSSHPLSFTVNAKDSSGNLIVGAPYPTPAAVTITGDTNGALSLGTTSVTTPGQAVNVTYDSTKALTSATINLAIPGSSPVSAAVQVNPIVFTPTSLPNLFQAGLPGKINVSEAGNANAFAIAAGSNATVACAPASCAPAVAGGQVVLTVTPVSSGSSAVTITDSYHTAATANYTITGQTGGSLNVSNYKIYEYTPAAPAGQRPYDITAGPDNKNVWFTDTSNSVIAAIDTSTCNTTTTPPTCTINETSATTGVWGIVTGVDGNMYVSTPPFLNAANPGGFTQVMSSATGCPASSCSTNFIGTYNTASRPSEMARTADGELWALDTLSGANNILGLGTVPSSPMDQSLSAGATATYGFIAASALPGPTGLFAGVRTNFAWTDTATSSVVFEYYSCSDCGGQAKEFGGFTGALGALTYAGSTIYLIDNAGNSIASFAPGSCAIGTPNTCTGVSQFPIPTSGAGAYKIVQGPDGNIWFTENGASKIGILVPSTGHIFEIPTPSSGAGPRGITVGPDGNVWFTEYNNGKIGEVVL